MKTEEQSVEIGGHYLVQRCDDTWHTAEVIETRFNDQNGGRQEYYVHYDAFNRRLDEWVEVDRFDLTQKVEDQSQGVNKEIASLSSADLCDGTDRKITRYHYHNI